MFQMIYVSHYVMSCVTSAVFETKQKRCWIDRKFREKIVYDVTTSFLKVFFERTSPEEFRFNAKENKNPVFEVSHSMAYLRGDPGADLVDEHKIGAGEKKCDERKHEGKFCLSFVYKPQQSCNQQQHNSHPAW